MNSKAILSVKKPQSFKIKNNNIYLDDKFNVYLDDKIQTGIDSFRIDLILKLKNGNTITVSCGQENLIELNYEATLDDSGRESFINAFK